MRIATKICFLFSKNYLSLENVPLERDHYIECILHVLVTYFIPALFGTYCFSNLISMFVSSVPETEK